MRAAPTGAAAADFSFRTTCALMAPLMTFTTRKVRVRVLLDGRPVPSASIEWLDAFSLGQGATTSDAEGRAELDVPTAGLVNVWAELGGAASHQANLPREGDPVDCVLELHRPGTPVVRVVDDTGAPIARADVHVGVKWASTDENGVARFPDSPGSRDLPVEVKAGGFVWREGEEAARAPKIRVADGEETQVLLTLSAVHGVLARFCDASGNDLLLGEPVAIVAIDQGGRRFEFAAAKGERTTILALVRGRYRIQVRGATSTEVVVTGDTEIALQTP